MFGYSKIIGQRNRGSQNRQGRRLWVESLESRKLLAELAQVRLEATDLNGKVVTNLVQGQEYYLNALVKDLRTTPVGVFSAYFDLTVNDSSLLSVVDQTGGLGGVLFSDAYVEGRSATNSIETADKDIDEAGAFTQNKYFGDEKQLFSMRFKADAQGTIQFGTNPAEDFGKVFSLRQLGTLNNDQVLWGTLSLNIVNVLNLTNDTATVAEDAAATPISVLNNDSGGAAAWTIQSISNISAGGTVQIASDGKSLTYKPAADFNGTETFRYRAVNGSGVPGEATVTVTVTAVNDAPRNQYPPAAKRVTDEDTTLTFATSTGNQIGIWDDTPVGQFDRINLFALDGGTLFLPNLQNLITQGKITLEGGANSTPSMQIRGSVADLNAALEGLQFTPKQDFFTVSPSQVARIRIWTREVSGATPLQADNTFEVTVNSVNDAPVNVVPGAQSITAIDPTVTFDASKRISTSDVDVGSGSLRATLTVNNGTLALGSTSGLTFRGGANNTASMSIEGTPANINNALLNLKYSAKLGASSDVLTILTSDLGNSGSGGTKTDQDTVNIAIAPANQAPVNTVPGAQTLTGTPGTVTFDSTKRISTNDPDVGTANLRVTLWVNGGVLKLGSTTGLSFLNGTADNSRYILFDGTQANVNAALLNLKYTANAGVTSDVLTIDVNDLGNTGAGGSKVDRDTIALSSNAVNQAPVNTVPGAQTYTSTARTVTFDSTKRISTNDPDAGQGNLRVTLYVNNGLLKLPTTAGLTFLNGTANNSKYMLFDGKLSAINAALLNLVYTANAGVTSDLLTFDVNDLGNTGAGGSKVDRDTVALSSAGINQAPVNTVPGAQVFSASTRTLTFDSTKRISTNDPDVGTGNLRVTLWVNNGVLKLPTTTGLSFLNGTANNSKYMLFDGKQADVNNALLNLLYTANAGVNDDVLTIDVYDLGNTGDGGAKADRDTIALTSDAPANQAPVNTVPGSQTYGSATRTVTFDSTKRISTNDPDVGQGNLRITLFVNNGVLTLGTTSGLTFLNGSTNNSRYMLFDGKQAAVNNALLNLKYVANAGTKSDILTLDTYDLGNTGTGGPKSDRDTVGLSLSGTSSVNSVSGTGGSGEPGSRNTASTAASASSTAGAADQVFAQVATVQSPNSSQSDSAIRLVNLLASANSGRAKSQNAADAVFGEIV